MATELLFPNSVVSTTNLSADIANLDEGIGPSNDLFDNVHATTLGLNANTRLVLGFPTPSGSLTSGAGLQRFRAKVRRNATGGNAVTVRLELWENGTSTGTVSGTTTVPTSAVAPSGGTILNWTWDSSVLANPDGSNVEIAIVQVAGGAGGGANNRRWLETDTAEWTADYTEPVAGTGYSFSTFF